MFKYMNFLACEEEAGVTALSGPNDTGTATVGVTIKAWPMQYVLKIAITLTLMSLISLLVHLMAMLRTLKSCQGTQHVAMGEREDGNRNNQTSTYSRSQPCATVSPTV